MSHLVAITPWLARNYGGKVISPTRFNIIGPRFSQKKNVLKGESQPIKI